MVSAIIELNKTALKSPIDLGIKRTDFPKIDNTDYMDAVNEAVQDKNIDDQYFRSKYRYDYANDHEDLREKIYDLLVDNKNCRFDSTELFSSFQKMIKMSQSVLDLHLSYWAQKKRADINN